VDLNLIWFVLMAVLLTGYAILDGFDLGVGILHPLARTDRERRLFVNAIGPLWDGNEVWLVTFGGALFAMFPEAYATLFSGFYMAIMLLLTALIFRAVSLEFRGKIHSPWWQRFWDFGFFGSSLLATLLFGIAVGNGLLGIPLDERGLYIGGFWNLLGPYQVLVGLLAVALFAMHGALFLFLKTEGAVRERLERSTWHTWGIFLVLYLLTTMYTLLAVPTATANFEVYRWAFVVVVINVLAVANIPRALFTKQYGQAFLSSTLTIVAMVFLFALAVYPNIVPASNDPRHSLTLYTAASSQKTLGIGLLIVVIGLPFVLAYTTAIYWTFRGKVQLGENSY
jgi:cytochrome d ubiquinol oxidase subunit II